MNYMELTFKKEPVFVNLDKVLQIYPSCEEKGKTCLAFNSAEFLRVDESYEEVVTKIRLHIKNGENND